MKKAQIAVDGASKGNPGPAGIGVVISDEFGKVVKEISQNIGQATNNFAEYTALIRALSEAHQMGFSHVSVQTDSELMARQVNGQYRVKSEGIIPLYETVKKLIREFKSVTITHVLREHNKAADKLASCAALAVKPTQASFAMESESPDPSDMSDPSDQSNPTLQTISVRTSSRSQMVDITREIQNTVNTSGISNGICIVHIPHTTAGITINENADPDVVRDILDTLNRLVPQSSSYRHVEGNADSHVKASVMGFSVTIFVEDGQLVLGTWQGIYFCEFDGPRNRKALVRVSK